MLGNNVTEPVNIQVLKTSVGLVFVEMTISAFHTYIIFDTKTIIFYRIQVIFAPKVLLCRLYTVEVSNKSCS